MTPLEQFLTGAVAALCTAVVAMAKYIASQRTSQVAREDCLHEHYRRERESAANELRDSRAEFSEVLLKLVSLSNDEESSRNSKE